MNMLQEDDMWDQAINPEDIFLKQENFEMQN